MDKTRIIDYGYDGEGVGRSEDKPVFLPLSILGEEVEFEAIKKTNKFIKAKPVKILSPAKERVKAKCPYFGKCGGCDFQHMDDKCELDVKRKIIEKQLNKVNFCGKIEQIACKNRYFYRNKVKLRVNQDGLCFMDKFDNGLCHISQCPISSPVINNAIGSINTFIAAQKLQKEIFSVTLRSQGDEGLILFEACNESKINYQGLQIMLGAKYGIFEQKTGILKHICGKNALITQEFDLNCSFSPLAFHQVNDEIGKALYDKVLSLTRTSTGTIINCYSGCGTLSGAIAKQGKRVFGVELGKSEHECAEQLKEDNRLNSLYNIEGDCAEKLGDLITSNVSLIIVDPPRSGCDNVVCEILNNSGAKNLIYISCDIATCVRDLGKLDKYKISSATLFDMFPKTANNETLIYLTKKS